MICTCVPCTTPAYGAPGHAHCAACCYGTLVAEFSHDCPIEEHRRLAEAQFPVAMEIIKPDKVTMPFREYPWMRELMDDWRRRLAVIDVDSWEITRGRVEVKIDVDTSALDEAMRSLRASLTLAYAAKFRHEYLRKFPNVSES